MTDSSPLLHIIARVMRVFFSLLYHTFAWTYDFVAACVSLGKWHEWVACILPEIEGPRVLEFGHGPGHLQAALAAKGIKHCGIDASPQMGMIASRRLRNIHGGLPIVRGYTQALPFPENTFDQIGSTFPSEYILDPRTIEEAFRVLVPGGKCIILPTAWITGNRWFEKAAAWLFKVTGQSQEWVSGYLKHFIQVGFEVKIKKIRKKTWSVNLIILEKPGRQSPI
jgi:ubiquinone/menaquinone biosynthesis C-methylase UbiE